jgi:hypothetical protein
MKPKFTLRDLFWLILVVALLVKLGIVERKAHVEMWERSTQRNSR